MSGYTDDVVLRHGVLAHDCESGCGGECHAAVEQAGPAVEHAIDELGRADQTQPEFGFVAFNFAGGTIDLQLGGPSLEWDEKNNRRSLYGKVSRYRTEKVLTLFDFPDPSITSDQRTITNTPMQWLFFLNSDFIRRQAEGLVKRIANSSSDAERIRAAYQIVYGRDPTDKEVARTLSFVEKGSTQAWTLMAQALLSSNEFLFVE
jgi:hypothetical protein